MPVRYIEEWHQLWLHTSRPGLRLMSANAVAESMSDLPQHHGILEPHNADSSEVQVAVNVSSVHTKPFKQQPTESPIVAQKNLVTELVLHT